MAKIYEVETHITSMTARQFYNHCKRLFKKKVGRDFEWSWIDSFDVWANPYQECDVDNRHEDWEKPLKEICKTKPFEYHLYLEGSYNFILEYFDGIGYMYVTEWEDTTCD